jgi:hypothetical protein
VPMHSCAVLCIICLLFRCRRGSAELLIDFDDHWHTNLSLSLEDSTTLLKGAGEKVCGNGVPRGYWVCQNFQSVSLHV